jgi:hypothetical protein
LNSIVNLPNNKITESGEISRLFINEGIKDFYEACAWIKKLPYGYNSDKYDPLIIFKEKKGTCSTKHGAVAALAEEINLPVYKFIGFYKLDNSIVTSVDEVLNRYNLKYIPQTHCFIGCNSIFVDLTEGNCHGKNKNLAEFDLIIKVKPLLNGIEEKELYKFGLDYYLRKDADLGKFSKDELMNILGECDTKHQNLCSLNLT